MGGDGLEDIVDELQQSFIIARSQSGETLCIAYLVLPRLVFSYTLSDLLSLSTSLSQFLKVIFCNLATPE